MKKITKNQLGSKIAKYGAFSVAIAGVADATGQVNFTDIDPDFNGVAVGDEFLIDLNGDGTNELEILIGAFNGNDFTALSDTDDALGLVVGQAVGNYTYALNLAEGDIIDANTGAFGATGSLCYLDGIAGTFCGDGNSTPDGFAGVSFTLNGDTHFGWIGLENVTAGSFTVTGFAFDETPDTAIAAGDGILSVESQVFANFEHFTSNGLLTLKAASPLENVVIYNIAGQEVMNRALSASTESVDLSAQATGVYIAKVTIDGAEKSFKVIR